MLSQEQDPENSPGYEKTRPLCLLPIGTGIANDVDMADANDEGLNRPTTPVRTYTSLDHYGLATPATPSFDQAATFPLRAEGDREVTEAISGISFLIEDPMPGQDPIAVDSTRGTASEATKPDGKPPKVAEGDYEMQQRVGFSDDESVSGDSAVKTHFEEIQEEIRKAQMTAMSSPISGASRRSTRVAKKLVQAPTTPTKDRTPPVTKSEVALTNAETPFHPAKDSSPESNLEAEAIVPLPPDHNPAFMTLDWQLQYPAGGSTHPSYPYPQQDPRLIFNPRIIPVTRGLPDISRLPPFVLPMGWRQITWSGLNPIVFDAYNQAFKLTPVGPLPLTHEEVQQGGLAKYVPGGECHPEAGLLPDASLFTDGSDQMYLDLDTTEWTFPWPKNTSFDVDTNGSRGSPVTPSTSGGGSDSKELLPRDVFDCPDSVIDVADAWRWIAERETSPNIPFAPSPQKTWYGTGVQRTNRRWKAPIPSLLCSTLPGSVAAPNDPLAQLLLNQNGREFCAFKSVATPVHIDITLFQQVEFTLVELLSYFPQHYMWRRGADRLVYSGLSATDITNFINWSRQLEGEAILVRSSINNHIWYEYEGPEKRKRVRIVRQDGDTVALTAQGWTYTTWELSDYPLLALSHGLIHAPTGVDAGPLTALMQWCREQKRFNVLLSEVPSLITVAGISPALDTSGGNNRDQDVLRRLESILKRDRTRVLKSLKELENDEVDEVMPKRRKRS